MDKQFQDLLLEEIRSNRKEIANIKVEMASMKLTLSMDINTIKVKFATIVAFTSVVLSTITSYLYKKIGG